MITNIKQYLKETNSVLLTEQAYEYLKEKASVIEKLEEIKTEMDIIAELEKIKAEIIEYRSKQNCSCSDCLDILDKHISELKGETE